ncbi:MAG: DUF368 domain-containing protein [Candidatus Omnitrophica bacterium]|nr:DUF368 domain-containing protein [Candidatus Omnitrophota bacterium]
MKPKKTTERTYMISRANIVSTAVLMLKGGVIGVANIIPGVSGGTLAVVLGVYDRLIEAITGFFERPEDRLRYLVFLGKIFLGAAVSILLLAGLMDHLLNYHYHKTMFLFMGLILGGVPSVLRSHGDMSLKPARAMAFLLGGAIVIALSVAGGGEMGQADVTVVVSAGPANRFMMLLSGFFAGGAMIVPGVSGSFVLVLLGRYSEVINAIKSLDTVTLLLVAAGAGLGVLAFSEVIKRCLEKIPAVTYYFILGLIFASFYRIFPGVPSGAAGAALCVLSFLAGAGAGYSMARLSGNSVRP